MDLLNTQDYLRWFKTPRGKKVELSWRAKPSKTGRHLPLGQASPWLLTSEGFKWHLAPKCFCGADYRIFFPGVTLSGVHNIALQPGGWILLLTSWVNPDDPLPTFAFIWHCMSLVYLNCCLQGWISQWSPYSFGHCQRLRLVSPAFDQFVYLDGCWKLFMPWGVYEMESSYLVDL